MSLAVFIADQRTSHDVPHAVSCRALDVSESWFYKWSNYQPSLTQQRRTELDLRSRRSSTSSAACTAHRGYMRNYATGGGG